MMKNSNNLTKISLLIIAVLALGSILPNIANAQLPGYVTPYNTTSFNGVDPNGNSYNYGSGYNSGYPYNYGYPYNNNYYSNNPTPKIYLVNPSTVNKNLGSVLVTITGDGFVPGAITKLNGLDQITTFINSSRIEMRLNDLAKMSTGNYIVNVYNPTPGGGFSNNATLTIVENSAVNTEATTNSAAVSTASKITTVAKKPTTTSTAVAKKPATTTNGNGEALAASSIFGITNFLPTNLIQWLILLIFILLLVCLWRSVYITDKDKSTPLKHH